MKLYEAAKTQKNKWALYMPNGCYDEMPKRKATATAKRLNEMTQKEEIKK